MKYRTTLLCGAALLLLPRVPAGAQTSFTLLDTNIHRDFGGTDSNLSAQPYLAKEVNYVNPDIWTIQEVGGNKTSFNYTNAYNGLEGFISSKVTIFGASPVKGVNYYDYICTYNDSYEAVAIVSRYPLLGTASYSDAANGFPNLRGLALVNVDLPGAVDVGVFTAHLKSTTVPSEPDNTTDAEKRQAEADADRASIAGWMAQNPTEGAILTGDFNESEDSSNTLNWRNHQVGDLLTDPPPKGGEAYHPITTLKSAGLIDPKPVSALGDSDTIGSTTTHGPTTRFDYTLYSSNGTLTYTGGSVFDTRQQTYPGFASGDSALASDHQPVVAMFTTVVPEPAPGFTVLLGLGLVGGMVFRKRTQ